MSLINCKNLSLGYDGKTVLNNLNLKLEEGDYLCIVGSNGTGKSTLIKGLLGLLKPQKGRIIYEKGFDSKTIGYLPQQKTINANFPASIYEVALSGRLNSCGIRPFYSKKDKEITLANLDKLGILKIKDKSYQELSGGQKQRVLLSRALGATKKLILLDEPVTGLDSPSSKKMLSIIDNLNTKENITVIMVTHDLNMAITKANKILHLDHNNYFYGSTTEYIESDLYKNFKGSDTCE